MSGAQIADEVHQALLEVGQDVGNGEFAVTFTRPGVLDESTYPPTFGAETTFTARAMQKMIAARDKDGTNVIDGDVMLMVSAKASLTPRNGDKVTISGREYSVEAVDFAAYGGVDLYYEVRARSGGPGAAGGAFSAAFIPQGSTGMVTSDGDRFLVRQ